jgi:Tfp pilus assembly protein PilZ
VARIEDTTHSVASHRDRRSSPRIQVLGQLHGKLVPIGLPVAVVDISLGGFAIKTSVAFPIGAVHQFGLTLGDGASVVVAGRVAYCRPDETLSRDAGFLTGFSFVEEAFLSGVTPEDIIDRITSSLSFDVQ